jgi:predicted lysophospholipase L1 biosynthesis ABC-type transport system permease subunit
VLPVAIATILALRSNAFDGTPGSVYNGRGVELRLVLLVLPIGAWIAGTLLLARLFARAATRPRDRRSPPFTHLVWALLSRSVGRRPWTAALGVIMVALVVALGTSIASFTASYDRAKAADARFVVGSDVRVTISPTSTRTRTYDSTYTEELQPAGIRAATPVVFSIRNAVVRSTRNEDIANVAAVDPSTFLSVAAVDDSNFVDMSARRALFLARTPDLGHASLARAVRALRTGPGSRDPLQIDTRATALDKDQSSLAALNIQGLLTLDSSYAFAMGTVAIAIFVFGLLLARRREYVTLRAQGVHSREIRLLIVAETVGIAVCGCLIGIAVGIGMSYFMVRVLRPLFVLRPDFVLPPGEIATLAALVIAAAVVSSWAATSLVNRLKPTELLRDE